MSKEIALVAPGDWTPEYEQLIIDTYCKGATKDEARLFATACKRTGLEPGKQIYAVKRWDSTLKREAMTVQTGIDGYRLIAERTGCYSPGKEATYVYDNEGNLLSATAYVKKLTKDGTWHEVSATAFYKEYVQTTKEGIPTRFWKQMPHGQLAKCAEALALRRAFPGEFSRIYTHEEMAQSTIEVEPQEQERMLTPEEVRNFINTFVPHQEKFCEYAEKLSVTKGWDMNRTMSECFKKEPAELRKSFALWLAKNRPLELEDRALGE